MLLLPPTLPSVIAPVIAPVIAQVPSPVTAPAESPPSILPPAPPVARPPNTRSNDRPRPCPTTIAALAPAFLRDLPSYANRVIVRNQTAEQMKFLPAIVVAGQADSQPLPVVAEAGASDPSVQQFFFTTLERQRVGDQLSERQQFHWLLLAPTRQGWQIVQSYTRLGNYPRSAAPLTPPRESSLGPIAQAAKLWLRDCQAGAVRFSDDRLL